MHVTSRRQCIYLSCLNKWVLRCCLQIYTVPEVTFGTRRIIRSSVSVWKQCVQRLARRTISACVELVVHTYGRNPYSAVLLEEARAHVAHLYMATNRYQTTVATNTRATRPSVLCISWARTRVVVVQLFNHAALALIHQCTSHFAQRFLRPSPSRTDERLTCLSTKIGPTGLTNVIGLRLKLARIVHNRLDNQQIVNM